VLEDRTAVGLDAWSLLKDKQIPCKDNTPLEHGSCAEVPRLQTYNLDQKWLRRIF